MTKIQKLIKELKNNNYYSEKKKVRAEILDILNTEELILSEYEVNSINSEYLGFYFNKITEMNINLIKNIFKNNLSIEIDVDKRHLIPLNLKNEISKIIIDIEKSKEKKDKFNQSIIKYVFLLNKEAFEYFNVLSKLSDNDEVCKVINILSKDKEQEELNFLIMKEIQKYSDRMYAELICVVIKRRIDIMIDKIFINKGFFQGIEHELRVKKINIEILEKIVKKLMNTLENTEDCWMVNKIHDILILIDENNPLVFEKIHMESQLKDF